MLVDIIAHPHWFWLTLGGGNAGTSGYLLWSGLAAVMVGIIEWFIPFSWTAQGSMFAVLTLVCVFLWYRWMRYREARQVPNTLNQRGSQMIGLQLILESALQNRTGHVRIGDSSWRVQAEQDLPAGTPV
ncbi:NfeD family protein [Pantoea sp. Eser]|nr:NfeD family protein [Pantoea sp. Eser]